MNRTIRIKRYLPYTREQVWPALTNSGLLGKWLMPNNLVPEPGREFTFRKDPQPGWDGITWCEVLKVEDKHLISYTYKGTASGVKTLACAGIHSDLADRSAKGIFTELDTVLTFTLSADCRGCCLELEHAGFRGVKLVLVSFVMGMGWKKLLKKLETLLAKMESETPWWATGPGMVSNGR